MSLFYNLLFGINNSNGKKKKEVDPIIILRGVACLMIVGWHINVYPFVSFLPNGLDLSWIFRWSASVGVWIFFIISGYFIGKGFLGKKYRLSFLGVIRFYYNRIVQILPYYYLIIIYFYIIYGKDASFPIDKLKYFLLLVGNNYLQTPFLGYLWFISEIMQLYLVSPIIYFILIKLRKLGVSTFMLSLLLILYSVYVIIFTINNGFPNNYGEYNLKLFSSLLINSSLFIFGFFMNIVLGNKKNSHIPNIEISNLINRYIKKILYGVLFILILISSYVTYYGFYDFVKYADFFIFLLPMFSFSLVGLFLFYYERFYCKDANQKDSICALITQYIFGIIGVFSYTIYLFHYPIIFLLKTSCWSYCSVTSFVYNLLVVMLISIILSALLKFTLGRLIFLIKF